MTTRRLICTGIIALGCLFGGLVAVLGCMGWRVFFVSTPSMATAAPVGSLVITQPSQDYHVSDIITFVQNHKRYTHRITAIDGERLITKGDLNRGTDPLPIHRGQVLGKAWYIHPWLGWVYRLGPWLMLGWLAVYAATRYIHLPGRWYYRVIGTTLVVCAVSLWFHPWVNFSVMQVTPHQKGVVMRVVNTGVFPFTAHHTTLWPGQDTDVTVTTQDGDGRYFFAPTMHHTPWTVAVILAICLLPCMVMLYGLRQIRRFTIAQIPERRTDNTPPPRWPVTAIIIALVCAIIGVCVIIFYNLSLSLGAFTGSIRNSTNNARSVLYNCRDATVLTAPGEALFSYGMTYFDTGTSERNLVANGLDGTWNKRVSADGAQSHACRRDRQRSTTFREHCLYYPRQLQGPDHFTLSFWFLTNKYGTDNGRIAAFSHDVTPENDGNVDRLIYLDKDGRINFGVYSGTTYVISSPAGKNYADNQWHHVAATLSPTDGMRLYVDGELANHNPQAKRGESFQGYWKFGCGRFSPWRNADGTVFVSPKNYYTGQLQFAAVHTTALSPLQVKELYLSGVNR